MRRPIVSKSERSGTGVDMANLSKAVCHGESDKCRFGNPRQESNFQRRGISSRLEEIRIPIAFPSLMNKRPIVFSQKGHGADRDARRWRMSRARVVCRLYAAFFTLPCGSMTNLFGTPESNAA